MEYIYHCSGIEKPKSDEWEARISILKTGEMIDAEVSARGSLFHIIAGRHVYGNFVCIPNWGIGTELASFSDRLWNYEHLRTEYPKLSKVDASTITNVLSEFSVCYDE